MSSPHHAERRCIEQTGELILYSRDDHLISAVREPFAAEPLMFTRQRRKLSIAEFRKLSYSD